MKDDIESHQQGEESRSAAVRRVLRWGLDRAAPSTDRRPVRFLSFAVGAAYIALVALGRSGALVPLFGVYILAVWGWASAPTWRPWLDDVADALR